jgi:hypothetical protein
MLPEQASVWVSEFTLEGAMHFLLTYLRFHQNTVKACAIVVGCVLLLSIIGLSRWSISGGRVLLGDVNAAPPPAPSLAPAHSVAAPPVRPANHMLQADSQARVITADLAPDAAYQQPLLAALNCVRAQLGQPPLAHDPQLSADAAALWKTMMLQPNASLGGLVGDRYMVAGVVPLSLTDVLVAQPGTDAAEEGVEQTHTASTGSCVMGGADMALLDLSGVSAIGIAVFPDPRPDDGLDDSSAVIVAR